LNLQVDGTRLLRDLSQVIAMVCHFVKTGSASGPFLIMCPASVLSNWAAELARWAPGLTVVEYKGSAEARTALYCKQVRLARQPLTCGFSAAPARSALLCWW
jgi:hypothetical protein